MDGEGLSGRKAVVSGAGNGIGRAISLALAGAGADIALWDIDAGSAESLSEEVCALGSECISVETDVSDSYAVERAVSETVRRFGSIDILVNNAGVCIVNRFLDTGIDEFNKMMDVNVKGAYLVCKAVLPLMCSQGSGRIINISSVAGKRGYEYYAIYSASKFAVIGLTQSIAAEFAPCGINANAICPGTVHTPLWREPLEKLGKIIGKSPDEIWEGYMGDIPLGRPQMPEDVAEMAVFLCGDGGRNITGQAINVCGGQQVY
ncbi:MAG: SDR family oxidoreductase [Clostridiales Family XIII bacterium]|jgi:NAD(P)-dependent dehydrogenase (short-subunit alcohol dehydrogenase family)|nr:SDR family oxidoreductase [Clostridiales Family XIII bacterium]